MYETRPSPSNAIMSAAPALLRMRAHSLSLLRFRLRLQLPVVLLDELPNLVGPGEQLRPLSFVERDEKTAEARDGHIALLADLETKIATTLTLETLIIRPELFKFGLQISIYHLGFSGTASREAVLATVPGTRILDQQRALRPWRS